MSAAPASHTNSDWRQRELLDRGLARALEREAVTSAQSTQIGGLEELPHHATPRGLGLASTRACVESNLARKGLWRSGAGGGGEFVIR